MLRSLFMGLSGLEAMGQWLSVIGNNIANSGTVGFKSSRPVFAELISAARGSSGIRGGVGMGARPIGVQGEFTQGSISATGNALDLAIEGNGFFLVKDAAGNSFYTRSGQFRLDNLGRLVDPRGYLLQGYLASASGEIAKTIGVITTTEGATASETGSSASSKTSASREVSSPPKATGKITIAGNLDANAAAVSGGFTVDNPAGSSNFSTSVSVYDALGKTSVATVYFTKTGPNAWAYNIVAKGAVAGSGSLSVQDDGTLPAKTTANVTIGGQSVELVFGNVTQYASPSVITEQSQDGYGAGSLQALSVEADGKVLARFSNGQTRVLAQVALSRFMNPHGLVRTHDTLFTASVESGELITGKPSEEGLGRVLGGSLEQSNVDLTREFVDMIAAQRAFQANSRAITASDELLAELANLKR